MNVIMTMIFGLVLIILIKKFFKNNTLTLITCILKQVLIIATVIGEDSFNFPQRASIMQCMLQATGRKVGSMRGRLKASCIYVTLSHSFN